MRVKKLDEIISFLVKCLEGHIITEEEKSKAKNSQNKNIIIVGAITIIFIWRIGDGLWW